MRASAVTFRADGGSSIGVGHFRRCSVLATEIVRNGGAVRLVAAPLAESTRAAKLWPYRIHWLESAAGEPDAVREIVDAGATLAAAESDPTESWVVLDHEGLGESWERIVRQAGHRVLAFDDSRDRRHHADIVVSDTPPPFDPAMNSVGDHARLLAGFEYALVEPAFASIREEPCFGAKSLLISYGGSDPTGETVKAIEAVRMLREDISGDHLGRVEVVVGPANVERHRIERAARGVRNLSIEHAPDSIAPHLQRADIVLSAGGNSLIETLASRKPAIVTQTAQNQELMVRALARGNLIVPLGSHDRVQPRDIASALKLVLSDYLSFAATVNERAPFDQFGAQRIVAAMVSFHSFPRNGAADTDD